MVKNRKILCPICDSKKLKQITQDSDFKYKNITYEVSGLQATRCNKCEFEFIPPKQVAFNETLIRDKKLRIDNFLSSSEIKEIRKLFDITQEQAAIMFGGGINGFSKYECGKTIQSTAMDRILRVTSEIPEAFNMVSHISFGLSIKTNVRNIITSEIIETFESTHRLDNVVTFVSASERKNVPCKFNLDTGLAVA